MKPSFKPVIIPSQKLSDGTYNVKIRVTYKRQSKRLSTQLYAAPSDLNKEKKLKEGGSVWRRAYDFIGELTDACAEIDFLDLQSMDVDGLVRAIDAKVESKAEFKLDFVQYMRDKAHEKGATWKTYRSAANALDRYMNGRVLNVNSITTRFLYGFEDYLRKEPKLVSSFGRDVSRKTNVPKGDCRAIGMYIAAVRHMFFNARREYNDPDLGIYRIPNNPFEYYTIPKMAPAKRRNKSQEFIQMIIDEIPKAKGAKRFALEVFIISFALEGMNLADMYTCAPAKGRWLTYNRRKTTGRRTDHAEHKVYVPDEILSLVDQYRDTDGVHMFTFHRRYITFNTFTNNANSALRRWRDGRDVDHFTMYAARHSFASIARKIGIEKATIDEMLCHVGEYKMGDVYIEKDWDIHRRANEKLLSLFDWSAIK
jgi:integrase